MRFSLLLGPMLLLAGCATMPPSRPSAVEAGPTEPAAAELAARYLAWRGGEAFDRLHSVYIVADIDAAGMKGVTREWRERGGRTRDELDLGVTRGVQVSTAVAGWNKVDALTRPLGRHQVQDNRREMLIEFGDAIRGGGGAKVERLADEEVDGRRLAVLRIRFGDTDSYDLFIDPATGALHGRRYTQNSQPRFVRFGDWRLVDGVRFPFVRETYRPNGKLDATLKTRSLQTNAALAPALFARPESEPTLSFAAGAKSTGPIRYNPLTGTRIYVPTKVNGRSVEVLLDSGADGTVFDRSFAESIGLKMVGSAVVTGSGGEQEAGYASGAKMQIGNMSLDLGTVGVVDLTDVSARLAIPLPVILGADVFLQSVVDIDPAGPTIAFHDPASFIPPPGATLVPLEPVGTLRVVRVSVEGLPDAPMIFDLGNGGYMSLTPAFWQQHKLLDGRRTSTRSSGAIGGEQVNRVGTLRTIRFAGVTFRDVPAEFDSPNVEIDSDREAGNVGMPLLGRFRMMIDFQNSRMFVVPISSRIAQPFPRDRSGLRLVRDGKRINVTHVAEGSPAAAAGWKAGEVITAVDGKPVGPGTPLSAHGGFTFGAAGTTITLTMVDGSTRKLTLANYF